MDGDPLVHAPPPDGVCTGNGSALRPEPAASDAQPLVVGISGGTGIVYGIRMLQALRAGGVPTHLVFSRGARLTLPHECGLTVRDVLALADVHHHPDDMAAAVSSGSFRTRGMVVAPCSVKSLAQIATGVCDTLLARAADVTLKERRRLVLMVRETPLTLTHLRNMATVTENGAIIAPPVPAFYIRPRTLDDVIDQSVGRVLDLFGIDTGSFARWRRPDASQPATHPLPERGDRPCESALS
ncbi:flavin prenyltransferase UbiX [Streptomyces albospinus]|uniref:Flavin prenyltransferase UbiX n=1 Tax=Streptomyces albospinus TaxID=285515 RepID=A0ABQ2V2V5_9ACTN|nr:UbiX family flavin prenyltransferase [Streptomyces albospinus]GGU65249.1 flavin prenyltransferase UbiX [Streptomyces albospinus]